MRFLSRVRYTTLTAITLAGVCGAGSLVAQTEAVSVTDVAIKALMGDDVTPTDVPVQPLTSTLQPTTPWPVPLNGPTAKPQHNLLAYEGVDTTAQTLLGKDYDVWKSHFAKDDAMSLETVPGLMMLSGCQEGSCDMHKSLLVVSPAEHKIYAAMVTEGKMAMWPSLMSWPDEAIPVLKMWLADATDKKPE